MAKVSRDYYLAGSWVKCEGILNNESSKSSLTQKSVNVTLAETVGSTGIFT